MASRKRGAHDATNAQSAGKARAKPRDWVMKAGKWDDKFIERIRSKEVRWSDSSHEDRLRIDPEIVENLRREGIALQWVTRSVYGKEQTHHFSTFERGGWEPVEPGDIEGVHETEIEGLVLCARPLAIHKKAEEHERNAATRHVKMREAAMYGGEMNAMGADDPSARQFNHVRRSIEPIAIPRDK